MIALIVYKMEVLLSQITQNILIYMYLIYKDPLLKHTTTLFALSDHLCPTTKPEMK